MLHIATENGFIVEQQQIIDWGIAGLDCISVLCKH